MPAFEDVFEHLKKRIFNYSTGNRPQKNEAELFTTKALYKFESNIIKHKSNKTISLEQFIPAKNYPTSQSSRRTFKRRLLSDQYESSSSVWELSSASSQLKRRLNQQLVSFKKISKGGLVQRKLKERKFVGTFFIETQKDDRLNRRSSAFH